MLWDLIQSYQATSAQSSPSPHILPVLSTPGRDTTFQSSAYGKRESVETTIDGRVMFDMLPYMFRNHKLSSYSLNSVSAELLGQQKEDVHHSIISDLQASSTRHSGRQGS